MTAEGDNPLGFSLGMLDHPSVASSIFASESDPPHMQQLQGDIPNYTDAAAIIQMSEIAIDHVGGAGQTYR